MKKRGIAVRNLSIIVSIIAFADVLLYCWIEQPWKALHSSSPNYAIDKKPKALPSPSQSPSPSPSPSQSPSQSPSPSPSQSYAIDEKQPEKALSGSGQNYAIDGEVK